MSQTPPANVTYMVMAEDAKRALRFYREAFGARKVWAADDGSWSVMDIGGRELCLHGNGTGASTDTGLAIEVEDLQQTITAVRNAGGHVLEPEQDFIVIVTDTEGNRFCVVRRGGCFLHPSLFPEKAAAKS